MLDRIRQVGWAAVEIGAILVALAVLLDVLLGKDGGPVVTSIAENTQAFLQSLPAGTVVGLVALGVLYHLVRSRRKI
jgi:hypothetical protein